MLGLQPLKNSVFRTSARSPSLDDRPKPISDQFKEIIFFLAENGFIAVLEEMTVSAMAAVERDGIASEQSSHDYTDWCFAGFEQKVKAAILTTAIRIEKTGAAGRKNPVTPLVS